MTADIIEQGILENVNIFLEPGIKLTTNNGSMWEKLKAKIPEWNSFKKYIPESAKNELIESIVGGIAGATVLATGGTPFIAGAATFATAVLINAMRKAKVKKPEHKEDKNNNKINFNKLGIQNAG